RSPSARAETEKTKSKERAARPNEPPAHSATFLLDLDVPGRVRHERRRTHPPVRKDASLPARPAVRAQQCGMKQAVIADGDRRDGRGLNPLRRRDPTRGGENPDRAVVRGEPVEEGLRLEQVLRVRDRPASSCCNPKWSSPTSIEKGTNADARRMVTVA